MTFRCLETRKLIVETAISKPRRLWDQPRRAITHRVRSLIRTRRSPSHRLASSRIYYCKDKCSVAPLVPVRRRLSTLVLPFLKICPLCQAQLLTRYTSLIMERHHDPSRSVRRGGKPLSYATLPFKSIIIASISSQNSLHHNPLFDERRLYRATDSSTIAGFIAAF
jgi:hypothetical protein